MIGKAQNISSVVSLSSLDDTGKDIPQANENRNIEKDHKC